MRSRSTLSPSLSWCTRCISFRGQSSERPLTLSRARRARTLVTFRRKNDVSRGACAGELSTIAAALGRRLAKGNYGRRRRSARGPSGHGAADVDQVVGDDAQADPALDAVGALVATSVQPMAPLKEADPTFTSGSPLLSTAKPALLLERLALGTPVSEVRDGDTLDAVLARGGFVAYREETRIGSDQPGWPPELLLMSRQRGYEQVRVPWALVVNLVMRDDLLLGLLDLDHLAELGGLSGFALADDFGVWFEQAHELAGHMRVAVEDAFACLPHHLLNTRDHGVQINAVLLDGGLRDEVRVALEAADHLAYEALGLSDRPPRDGQQPAIALLQPILALLAAAATDPTDLQHAAAGAPGAIAQFGTGCVGQLLDLLHRPRQHPHAVAQQRGVGRVVDVGFHHRGIDAHAATLDDLMFLGNGHHAPVDLFDDVRPQGYTELAHRLGIRHLGCTHPSELAIHQVGSHLALQHGIAPVAHMLEQQQSQHDFRRRALAPARTAMGPAARQRLVDGLQQVRIGQHLIDRPHPVFPQSVDLLGHPPVGEVQLPAAQFDHVRPWRGPWPVRSWRSAWRAAACPRTARGCRPRSCPQSPGSAPRRDGPA